MLQVFPEAVLICTRCGSANCSRSHRRNGDLVLSALGLLPWRCKDCHKRFYARRVPLRYLLFVRCPRCASLQLLRTRRRRPRDGFGIRLVVLLGARLFHCDFCRHTFPSWRPLYASEQQPVEEHSQENGTSACR